MENKVCLKLESISKKYKKKNKMVPVLEDINLSINKGDFVGIIGKSGAGKTTLLNIIGMLSEATSGAYYIYEKNTTNIDEKTKAAYRNHLFGFVLQEYGLIETYSVIENVQIPLGYAKEKISKEEKEKKIFETLKSLGIESKMNDSCSELSGGQRQRVAIARALINSPEIIIADEPTGAMDVETAQDFLELMHKINIELKKTIIMVTHDDKMLKYCNRVLEIKDGKLSF